MDNKEVEKKLQESADHIETRDFSLVWKDIKHKVEVPQKKTPSLWLKLAASAASIVVACSVIIPLALAQNQHQADTDSSSNSSEQVYFTDELAVVEVTEEGFFQGVMLAGINLVNISDYIILSSALFETQDAIVKGGQLELIDNLENSIFYLTVRFYDQSVKVEDQEKVQYDFNYSLNDVSIEYRVKVSYPESGLYMYDIKANVNTVNYYIEFTSFTEDIKPFLDEFFQ